MENDLSALFAKNRAWAAEVTRQDADFFERLSRQQNPEYLWIGCADSRVPANQIVGLLPGEMFVHRNVANLVVHTDLNCLSVLQYAVEVLCVRHVIVCGHYGCGGVRAAVENKQLGLIDNWLRHVQDAQQKHSAILSRIAGETECLERLCELNVIEQMVNVCRTTIVQDAWERGQPLAVHGWIYKLQDGLVHALSPRVQAFSELETCYKAAIAAALPGNYAWDDNTG